MTSPPSHLARRRRPTPSNQNSGNNQGFRLGSSVHLNLLLHLPLWICLLHCGHVSTNAFVFDSFHTSTPSLCLSFMAHSSVRLSVCLWIYLSISLWLFVSPCYMAIWVSTRAKLSPDLSLCLYLFIFVYFCTFLWVLLSLPFSLSLHVCPYLYLSMSMTVSFYATSLRISIPFSVSDFVPVLHLSVCLLVYHKRLNLSIHICMPVYLSVCLSVCVCKIPIPPSFPLHSFPKDKDCAWRVIEPVYFHFHSRLRLMLGCKDEKIDLDL